MRIPDSLVSLHDQGIISEVLRPLMSGKEAQVYLTTMGDKLCVAKVYKDAQTRTFKHRADYTEGRKVRNSRDQRAMAKRSKHGREQEEAAWRSTEVDVIYRLQAGGVRVPIPYHFIDGVLIMELVMDANGDPAPRLGDVSFEPEEAIAIYDRLIREVVRMLCAGVVHGDLSDFNVLLGVDGPVIIDFPQSVDTAHNNNARQLLLRDVDNLHSFLTRFVPNARRLPYAEEMWDLHQNNALTPDTRLTGRYQAARQKANIGNVMGLIEDANRDERKRRDALGLRGGPQTHELNGHWAPAPRGNGQGAQQSTSARRGATLSDGGRSGAVGQPNGNHRRADTHSTVQHPARHGAANSHDAVQHPARHGGDNSHNAVQHPAPNKQAPRVAMPNSASTRNIRPSSGGKGAKSVEVIVLRRTGR